MDVLNDNPLAVLHLLCAIVALVSGFTVRLFGWRGRPPGGAAGVRRNSASTLARRTRSRGKWATLRLFALGVTPSMVGLCKVVLPERDVGEEACYLQHA